MATGLPSNIYSGGAVVVNSQPATQFYLQSIARKRAKDEALNNYFQNMNKSVTPTGMRTQDIENGWMQKVNDWRDFYGQNKDAILHPNSDNGKAYNEYMGRYQDILNDTQKSINATKSVQPLVSVFSDPNKRRLIPESSIDALHQNDLPIYDPNYKPFDIQSLNFNDKPFDLADQQKYIQNSTKGLEMGDIITKQTLDPTTHKITATYHSTYNPDALAALHFKNASNYRNDASFADFIDKMSNDPNVIEQLNPKFKAAYGKDIQTPEDVATAWNLNSIQTEKDKQKQTGYSYPPNYIANPNTNNQFNFGVEMTNALRTNDADAINNLRHILRSGNGKTKFYDSFVRNVNGTPFLYLQYKDENDDPQTVKYAVDDPSLPDLLTGFYQQVMGSDANQEKQQYPTSKTNTVITPPKRTQPPTTKYHKGSLD